MHRSTLFAAAAAGLIGGVIGINLDRSSNAVSPAVILEQARVAVAAHAATHCEIPCGIFDDAAEIERLRLDAQTIQKANAQIENLMFEVMSGGDPNAAAQNVNTMTRWVMVKEEHSRKIQDTVAWYFMNQRVKAPTNDDADAREKYHGQLAAFHAVSVAAMKAAQSVDAGSADRLFDAIDVVAPWYQAEPKADGHTHP